MIAVNIGGSLFYPQNIEYSSGLSVIFLLSGTSKLGRNLGAIKIKCSECNTPIFEISAASLIVRSKHHSNRHTTSIPISTLLEFIPNEKNINIL